MRLEGHVAIVTGVSHAGQVGYADIDKSGWNEAAVFRLKGAQTETILLV